MRRVLLLCLLTACSREQPETPSLSKTLSPTKQKQKIALLKKKLENAEREREKVQGEVEFLRHQMESAELDLIRRQVSDSERKFRNDPQLLQGDRSALFLQEREILHKIIQGGPSSAAFEAQAVLDQILRLITNISS